VNWNAWATWPRALAASVLRQTAAAGCPLGNLGPHGRRQSPDAALQPVRVCLRRSSSGLNSVAVMDDRLINIISAEHPAMLLTYMLEDGNRLSKPATYLL